MIELREGCWQNALAGVEVDVLITDPPYGARTHANQKHGRKHGAERKAGGDWVTSRGIGYDHMTEEQVRELIGSWAPRVREWICIFCSHDLAPAYEAALRDAKRYVFAPIPCVQFGMNCRLAGDGPSNWTCWLIVARPMGKPIGRKKWGTKRGAYVGNPFDPGQNTATATRRKSVVGSKPLWLMRDIVGDYSLPGQMIADPFAGGATTLIAGASLRRNVIGAEVDPKTYALAVDRIEQWEALPLFERAEQMELAV